MRMGLWCKPVVVIDAQEAGHRVLERLQREWYLGFEPVGVYDNRLAPVSGEIKGVPYRGTLTDAVALAREGVVDTVIFAVPNVGREHVAEFVTLASQSFRHVVITTDLNGAAHLDSTVVAK